KSYVVFIGRQPGVYDKWCEASEQVRGFSGACYKGFDTKKEAEEAYSCYLEAMNGPRVHKKCECEKTSTPSTSKPQHAKNSSKLVKVLRDLAVELLNHAAKMEKVVDELGQILEDMAVSDDE
ncbi:proton pump-interactor 1-like, partial [Dorcoceras hygrometricum]